MTTLYCTCDSPLIDVEHDAGCRRCGLPVDFTAPAPRCGVCGDQGCEFCPAVIERDARRVSLTSLLELERRAVDNGRDRRAGRELDVDETLLVRRELLELARRQEFVDRLSPLDEAGSSRVELVVVGAAVLVLVAAAVAMFWHYLIGAGVVYAAWRMLRRDVRRRRPRSSWSSLGKTAAMMYAAWNSRGLVHRNGRPLRVSVPARAGREHVDEYGEIPF